MPKQTRKTTRKKTGPRPATIGKLCSDERFKALASTTPDAAELLCTLARRAPAGQRPLDSLEQLIEHIRTPDEFNALETLLAEALAADSRGGGSAPAPTAYERHKERARQRQAQLAKSGRDVGPLPAVSDPDRKAAAAFDLCFYFEAYHPTSFPIDWSADHLKVIRKIQRTVLKGGVYAIAMPRGSGKTTMAIRAAIWALLYGHHRYVMLICANKSKAQKALAGIQFELEFNSLLYEDFPEVCHPIRCLERIQNRARGQLLAGRPTNMTWTGSQLVLPTIEGSQASGHVLEIAGLKGSEIRGAQYIAPDLSIWRPSLVLPDDPQTRDSARSLLQTEEREQLLKADALGMAGPGETIAMLVPCTVIEEGDLAANLLDRARNPEFRGERMQMLYEWPDRLDLWEQYQEIRRECLAGEDDEDDEDTDLFQAANDFYLANRNAMDKGARVAWEHRAPGCLSALQYAMHLYFRDAPAFWSEYQNDPSKAKQTDDEFLTKDQLATNTNGLEWRQIPDSCTLLTAHVDVQHKLLYFVLCAWEPNFTGYVVDYGTLPEQLDRVFAAKKARPTLRQHFKGTSAEGAWWAGLEALAEEILAREWTRDDGSDIDVACCLVDAADGAGSAETVKKWCRYNKHKAITFPAIGYGVTATRAPISAHKKRKGERRGGEWRLTAGKSARTLLYDPSFYKTQAHRRLATPQGQAGSLTFYGFKDGRPVRHDFLAAQLTSETRDRIRHERTQRVIDVWTVLPNQTENHWLDSLTGSVVAAEMCGITTAPVRPVKRKPTRPNYQVQL